jgi:Xaa-Pro aminopeptidase
MKMNPNKSIKVQEKMLKEGIDAIILPLGINFQWLFNHKEKPSERPFLSVIEASGSPKILAPSFEVDRAKRTTGVSEVIGWEETEDPYSTLVNNLLSSNVQNIGIEPKMWYGVFQSIANKLPAKKFVSAEAIFDSLRMVKDKDEINNMQRAFQKTSKTIIEVLYDLELGITESTVQSILKDRLSWGQNEEVFHLAQFGENSALPHYYGGKRQLKKDDVVLIDAGGTINNYWGDITITTVFGKASNKFKEIFEIVNNANICGKETASQGTTPHEIDSKTRQIIAEKGYGEYFTHRTGHGLGLEVHEHPYIVMGNNKPLKPGSCFTIEPGIYLPGNFGVRIEDNVIYTENGIISSEIPRYDLLEV